MNRVERKLNVKELQENVRKFNENEEKKYEEKMEKSLLEIADFIEEIQDKIITLSKLGETKCTFQRYEDEYNKGYIDELKYFFTREGLKVEIKSSPTIDSLCSGFYMDTFFGIGSYPRGIKYTFTVKW